MWIAFHKPQKMLLKRIFVCLMCLELNRKRIVMCVCECVGGVVNQFTKGIIVKEIQPFFPFQSGSDGVHKAMGVPVVVSTQPLAAEGTLQICSWVSVWFNAANPKRGLAVFGHIVHIVFNQILGDRKSVV